MPRVLFVDDYYEDFKDGLEQQFGNGNVLFQKEPNIKAILGKIAGPPLIDLVLLDVMFAYDEQGSTCSPRNLGHTILDKIKASHPAVPVLMLTTTAQKTNIQYPLSNGVTSKPDNFSDKRFYEMLFNEASYWLEVSNADWKTRWGVIIGNNPKMIEVARSIVRFTKYRSTKIILVMGETGTGKEEICKAVHKESGFRLDDDSYQVVHCGAMDPRDLRIDLGGFPKQKGGDRSIGVLGRLEGMGWRGTLVFDEVDDLSLESQNIPNRILEGQPFPQENNTGRRFCPGPDIRYIFTAQRDIEQMVTSKQFRKDLWGRINSCRIHLPLLCERKEIIPQLFKFYIEKLTQGRSFDSYLRRDVEEKLQNHNYPGNIREFKNILERAINQTANSPLRPEDIDFSNKSIKSYVLDPENVADLIFNKHLTWSALRQKGIKRKSEHMGAILKRLMEKIVEADNGVLTEELLAVDYLRTTRDVVARMISENGLCDFKKSLKNKK